MYKQIKHRSRWLYLHHWPISLCFTAVIHRSWPVRPLLEGGALWALLRGVTAQNKWFNTINIHADTWTSKLSFHQLILFLISTSLHLNYKKKYEFYFQNAHITSSSFQSSGFHVKTKYHIKIKLTTPLVFFFGFSFFFLLLPSFFLDFIGAVFLEILKLYPQNFNNFYCIVI